MTEEEARAFVARYHQGVLATIKRDGRPQMSNISYALDPSDGLIKVSTGAGRAKVRNARRDPRVSMSVQGDNWHQYLVVEGTAELQEQDPLPALRRLYEMIRGAPHPDWDEFDQAMCDQRRLIFAIRIERMYPLGRE
ncbi:MAG TPA: PPOX class F420-dependent oxidoreductase [Chloroflexota bacterium]|jgi:PPOX class probable F420-dependent enzyme